MHIVAPTDKRSKKANAAKEKQTEVKLKKKKREISERTKTKRRGKRPEWERGLCTKVEAEMTPWEEKGTVIEQM